MSWKILSAIAAIAFIAFAGQAADQPSLYGSEFSIDLFGSARTPDLDNYTTGAGVGLTYFLSKNFGISGSASGDWAEEGHLVDQLAATGVYRIPIGKSAIYGRAGAEHDLSRDGWSLLIGPGVEHRFARGFGLFFEALMNKRLDDGEIHAIGKFGARLAF